jgi:hypothetical protein
MEATRAQSAEMLSREPRHRPYGATWLTGERWTDGPDPAQDSSAKIAKTVYWKPDWETDDSQPDFDTMDPETRRRIEERKRKLREGGDPDATFGLSDQ